MTTWPSCFAQATRSSWLSRAAVEVGATALTPAGGEVGAAADGTADWQATARSIMNERASGPVASVRTALMDRPPKSHVRLSRPPAPSPILLPAVPLHRDGRHPGHRLHARPA